MKYPISYRVLKEIDKILFVENQVHAIVPAVLVLAKPESLPRTTVHRENIPLDSPLVVVIETANAYGLLLDAAHF
jgi:hypothetical protein